MASHDLTTEIYYSGAWHDISTSVRNQVDVSIDRGVRNPGDEATPATATLRLEGRTGELNPRNATSSLFGLIGPNTPLRLTLGASVRYVGEIKKWVPGKTVDWKGPGSARGDAWIDITAQGILGRLSRGVDTAKSALERSTLPMAPVAYWRLEDGADAATGASALNDQNDLVLVGTAPTWANDNQGFAGSLPGPKLVDQLTVVTTDVFRGKIPGLPGDQVTVSLWYKATTDDTNPAHIISKDLVRLSPPPTGLANPSDQFVRMGIETNNGGSFINAYVVFDGSGYGLFTNTDPQPGVAWDGRWHNIVMQLEQTSAGHIEVNLWFDGVLADTTDASSPPYTLLAFTDITIIPAEDMVWGPSSIWVDHVAVFDNVAVDPAAIYAAGTGWTNEFVEDRFTRLCDEAGITSSVVGTIAYTHLMGPQYPSTLLGLFAEIERTDDGQIYDARTFLGLELRTGASLLRQTPALTLDYTGQEIAPTLLPVVGDEHIRNDVIAKNPNGSAGRYVQESGPHNVQAPGTATGAVGRYDTTMEVNFADQGLLRQAAAWRVGNGTFDGTWYQMVTADLDSAPSIAGDVDAVDIGDMTEFVGLAVDEVADGGTVRHLAIGYGETIGPRRRTVTFYQRPEPPLRAGVLGAAGQAGYLDSKATTTAEALDTTETGVDVAIAGNVGWTHASGDYKIMIDGERMIVTGVSAIGGTPGALTQTLTVTRSDNGVVKSHVSGVEVHVADPFILAL